MRQLLFLAIFAAAALAQPRVAPARIDALAEGARAKSNIPGLAVAIITPERTYLKGYGVRSLAGNLPVTEHTAFDVGSVTKSFTALGAAVMVDEGKLDWDKPVREYLPWFRLYDPAASELITLRDLLTHRSGLPRYDFLRFAVKLSREELLRRLRYLPPTASFRERYQYQNLMYTAAGYLAGHAAGMSWEELTEKRILAPLGMSDSSVRAVDIRKSKDYAEPHERVDGVLKPVPFYDYQEFGVGPNGAVNSSVSDLVRYVRFHMGDGTPLLSKRQLEELQRPQVVVNETNSYALGWQVDWSPGFKVVSHGGSITGFNAFVGFAPERKEAVVVLTNVSAHAGEVAMSLMSEVLGWKFARPRPPQATVRAEQAPPVQGPPSRALAAYAGRYSHPAFGPCEVAESAGVLTLRFPALTANLRHVRFDYFERPDGSGAQFVLDPRGQISAMKLRVDPAAPPVEFRRVQ